MIENIFRIVHELTYFKHLTTESGKRLQNTAKRLSPFALVTNIDEQKNYYFHSLFTTYGSTDAQSMGAAASAALSCPAGATVAADAP